MENIVQLLPNEEFKTHPDFLDFKISNMGRVLNGKGELAKQYQTKYGYCSVGLCGSGKKRRSSFVHRLVVETFLGKIPEGLEVDHLNGIKGDNRLANLEVVTASENNKRAYAMGLKQRRKGSDNSQSKLTDGDILLIYDLILDGKTNQELGEKFALHERYISLLRHGKRWQHLYEKHPISITNRQIIASLQRRSPNDTYPNRLTPAQTFEVLDLIVAGNVQSKEIARMYKLHPTTISHIKRRKMWVQVWEDFELATTIEKTVETRELSRVSCKQMAVEKQGVQTNVGS